MCRNFGDMRGYSLGENFEVDVGSSSQLYGVQYANPAAITAYSYKIPQQFTCVTALLLLSSNKSLPPEL